MADIRHFNPFYTGIQIPDDFFCDREKETGELISLIRNGNNVVLQAYIQSIRQIGNGGSNPISISLVFRGNRTYARDDESCLQYGRARTKG